jgi:hypothetical protein
MAPFSALLQGERLRHGHLLGAAPVIGCGGAALQFGA